MNDLGTAKVKLLRLLEEILQLPAHKLKGNESIESLALDSLAMMNLIGDIDREFGVTLSPTTLYECKTVEDLVAAISNK